MRLILSTFRDGGGQVVLKRTGESMPGFRDFERTVAAVCGGQTREDKGVFDVLIPVDGKPYGISCKMSSLQPFAHQAGFMELTNSAKKFADPRTDIDWTVEGRKQPTTVNGYIQHNGRRHRLWQVYPNSGGQLKYYPPLTWATWSSEPFALERPPAESLPERAAEYFPKAWSGATSP